MAKTSQNILVVLLALVLTGIATHRAAAAVKAFYLFQSSATETVPVDFATNYIVTLTYSNTSGTIDNAVFTNGVSITPSGQGVTVSLDQFSPAIAKNGGTGTLPLTISAPANTTPNTTYQIIVSATNKSFTANVPSGIASLTNTFIVGGSAYSNGFTVVLSPTSATCLAGIATNFTSTVTLEDHSLTISGTVTNGVTVSPSGQGVTASLNSIYAPITNHFGQTNLTLTINVSAGAAPGAYTVIVKGTNNAFTANSTPGVASAIFTLNLTAVKKFTMSSVTPAAETVVGGVASKVTAMVTLTNLSTTLAEAIPSGVTVIGPDTINVTAGLSPVNASPSAGGGTAALTLSITNNGSSLPGTYQVIVGSTNNDFTDNSPIPGVALATNLFTVSAPPLSIQNFSLSGMNLTFTGCGGGPNGQYVVYSATNLTLPLAQWTPVMTNMFDASGNFNALIALTNTPNPNAARQFFAIFLPATGTNQVATPTFSPVAGPFFAETPVTITSATSNAIIRYTTDGSTPSESNGALYTGPVTMHKPVNNNSTGTITNASGVTMLKAVAYKGGMPASAVWTGIYTILDPVAYPPASVPSPLCGIAHMAYNVSSSNWDNIFSLWTNYYGFAAVLVSNNFALIKINDQQYIEMYRVPLLVSNQWQLANYGFEVTNAEAYRQQLSAAGVSVPGSVTTNALGNLSFFTVDPDGHTNEWVQYLTNSITGLSQGLYMPGTAVVGFANCFGITTTYGNNNNVSGPPITYYVTNCGFQGTGNSVDIPSGGKVYIELLTTGPGGATQDMAGKHGKLQFMNFRGMTLFQTINILTNRNPSIPCLLAPEGRHYAFDVDTLDLSRIRINDY